MNASTAPSGPQTTWIIADFVGLFGNEAETQSPKMGRGPRRQGDVLRMVVAQKMVPKTDTQYMDSKH